MSSGLFVILILPLALIMLVLWLCRKYNFTLLPVDMRGASGSRFELPTTQGNQYQWFTSSEPFADNKPFTSETEKNNQDKL